MDRNSIIDEYFDWMYDLVCGMHSRNISFRKLFSFLHCKEFIYSMERDKNRASDGENLRYRFVQSKRYSKDEDFILDCLSGPCSVLEMMIALSMRIEETIMDDPRYGNRMGQWFWEMIVSLGLNSMIDDRFNKRLANDILDSFLSRDYLPNGKGGLFTVRNSDIDMRDIEIWVQMCWYLNEIV